MIIKSLQGQMDSQENSTRFPKKIYSQFFFHCFLKQVETEGTFPTPLL